MSEPENLDAAYLMANLPPRLTGLPMVAGVSERGDARHDARLEVYCGHGDRMQCNNTASVAVRPSPSLAAGQNSPADLALGADWIGLDELVVDDDWEERIFTDELIAQLRACRRQP